MFCIDTPFGVNEYLDIRRYSYCWRVRGWTVDIYRPICSRVHLSRFNMPSSFSGCPPHSPHPHSPHPPLPKVPLLHTHIKLLSMLLQDPLHTLTCTVSAYQILQPALPHNGAAEQILLELHHCHTLTCTASVQLS